VLALEALTSEIPRNHLSMAYHQHGANQVATIIISII
jgi:hypothetical protein